MKNVVPAKRELVPYAVWRQADSNLSTSLTALLGSVHELRNAKCFSQ